MPQYRRPKHLVVNQLHWIIVIIKPQFGQHAVARRKACAVASRSSRKNTLHRKF